MKGKKIKEGVRVGDGLEWNWRRMHARTVCWIKKDFLIKREKTSFDGKMIWVERARCWVIRGGFSGLGCQKRDFHIQNLKNQFQFEKNLWASLSFLFFSYFLFIISIIVLNRRKLSEKKEGYHRCGLPKNWRIWQGS